MTVYRHEGVAVLEQGGFRVDVKTKLPKERLLEEIKEYDGIIVRSGTKVTADVIDAGSRLKIIGRAGTGLTTLIVKLLPGVASS